MARFNIVPRVFVSPETGRCLLEFPRCNVRVARVSVLYWCCLAHVHHYCIWKRLWTTRYSSYSRQTMSGKWTNIIRSTVNTLKRMKALWRVCCDSLLIESLCGFFNYCLFENFRSVAQLWLGFLIAREISSSLECFVSIYTYLSCSRDKNIQQKWHYYLEMSSGRYPLVVWR